MSRIKIPKKMTISEIISAVQNQRADDPARNCHAYLESKGASYIEGSRDDKSWTMSWTSRDAPDEQLTATLDLTWQSSLHENAAAGGINDGDFRRTNVRDERGGCVGIFLLAGCPATSIEKNSNLRITNINSRLSLVMFDGKWHTPGADCSPSDLQILAATLGDRLVNAFDLYAMHVFAAHDAYGLSTQVLDHFTKDFKAQIEAGIGNTWKSKQDLRKNPIKQLQQPTKVRPIESSIDDNPLRGTW